MQTPPRKLENSRPCATKPVPRCFLRFRYSNVDEQGLLGTLPGTRKSTSMIKTTFFRSLLGAIALAALPFSATTLRAGTGDIYETNDGNILRFKPIGGSPGTFATGFTNPKGLVFDGNGHLYVADPGKNAVIVFTVPDGTGATFVSGLSSPTGVALDKDGNLYVAESGSGNILKFAAADRAKTTFASNVGASAGLTFDSNGNLFAADFSGGKINKITPTGTVTTFASGLNHPAGLAFDNAGNLFEADSESSTIFKFAPDGTKTSFVTGVGRPFGIAFESTGNLVVADNENGATLRYSTDGVKSVVFQSNFNTPQFVAVEPAQHKLLNISARGLVQGGNDVLIAGFVVGGNGPVGTSVLVRALGPSLAPFGISNSLPDPFIELRDSSGNLIASNNNWKDSQESDITNTHLQPTDDKESAILTTLDGGSYTAIVGTATGAPGTAVVEVYSLSNP
jgi:sugar lactone lactonase YvrE